MTRVTCASCGGTGFLDPDTATSALDRGRVILVQVAQEYEVSVAEMIAKSRRNRKAHLARVAAARRMRNETPLGLKQIGFLLGHRHHSTIIYMLNR